MYEHKREPLAPAKVYYLRIGKTLFASILIMLVCLAIGTIGFKMTVEPAQEWIDCLHNASMLLGGMGPVIVDIENDGGKYFSSFYALFSGLAFVTNMSILIAPMVHRFFHKLHLEDE
jgi:hypothetical protein